MLKLKEISILIIIYISVGNSARLKQFCSECEEELWEEVPCQNIFSTASSTTTSTTTATPIESTIIGTTFATPTTTSTISPTTEVMSDITSIPTFSECNSNPIDDFQKCYCECKVGCKEFCRKVMTNVDQKQQITQISKTSEPKLDGRLEIKHFHQRKFVPLNQKKNKLNMCNQPLSMESKNLEVKSSYPLEGFICLDETYTPLNTVGSSIIPSKLYENTKPLSLYENFVEQDNNDSLEELTKLLSSENAFKVPYSQSQSTHDQIHKNHKPNKNSVLSTQASSFASTINSADPVDFSLLNYISNNPDNGNKIIPTAFRDFEKNVGFNSALESYLKNFVSKTVKSSEYPLYQI